MVDEIPTKSPHLSHGSERSGKANRLSEEQAEALAERFKPVWSVEPTETGAAGSSTASPQTRAEMPAHAPAAAPERVSAVSRPAEGTLKGVAVDPNAAAQALHGASQPAGQGSDTAATAAEPQRHQRQITMLGLSPPSNQEIQAAIRELDATKGAKTGQPTATASPEAASLDANTQRPARAGSRQATMVGVAPEALNQVLQQPAAVATGPSSAPASAVGSLAAPYVTSSLDDDFDLSQLRRGRKAKLVVATAVGVIAIGLAVLLPGPAEPDEQPGAAEHELAVGVSAQQKLGSQKTGQDRKEPSGSGDNVNPVDEQASPPGNKESSGVGTDTSKDQEDKEQLAAKVRTKLNRAEAPRAEARVAPNRFPKASRGVRKSSAVEHRVGSPTPVGNSRAATETKHQDPPQQQPAPAKKPGKTQMIVREAPF